MKTSKMQTSNLIRCHFGRLYRYESIRTFEHLEYIIDEAAKLIEASKKELNRRNIDIDKLLQTPKGATAYLEYCAEQEHTNAIHRRCDQCANFGWFPSEDPSDLTEYRCILFDEKPMHCNSIIDAEDFPFRIQKAIKQCSECPDVKTRYIDEIQFVEHYCPHKYNAFKCPKCVSKDSSILGDV